LEAEIAWLFVSSTLYWLAECGIIPLACAGANIIGYRLCPTRSFEEKGKPLLRRR
jgi:hypothetical protein